MTREELEKNIKRLFYVIGASNFFDEPEIRIASAKDPYFLKYKTLIGENHLTPQEALNKDFPESTAKSVISWALPVNAKARKDNSKEKNIPAVSWAIVRSFGELNNEEMQRQLCTILINAGFPTVSPQLQQLAEGFRPGYGGLSNWSERHIAWTAGLGTFGLSASLITRRGSAVRLGSVVTSCEFEPDIREYGDEVYAWCTLCNACMRRCPANAIGPRFEDRDKTKCANYASEKITPLRMEIYGWPTGNIGCGLCQTGIPCENKRP